MLLDSPFHVSSLPLLHAASSDTTGGNLAKHCHYFVINCRDLLEFWRVHYLQRAKDRLQLEQSSNIGFEHWQKLVDVLLKNDSACQTSIIHYLSPWQQQVMPRIRAEVMQRDA